MADFFHNLGRQLGYQLGKADQFGKMLFGPEPQATQAEFAIGRHLAQSFDEQCLWDQEVLTLLTEIGIRLNHCLKKQQRLTVRLLDLPEVNGFALPGGFIFVTRGLMEFCGQDREELAFVLGHELGHVVKKHARDRFLANTVLQAVVSRMPASSPLSRAAIGQATQLLQQSYSQSQELEADRFGLDIARLAGFAPEAALRLMARFQEQSGSPSGLLTYFSSHPPVETRLRRLKQRV
jgi:predicted Zn-dependent protease